MKYAFLVMVMGYWGRGKTIDEAAKNCLKQGAGRKDFAVLSLVIGDDTPEVDSQGWTIREQGSENNVISKTTLGKLLSLENKKHDK